MDNEDTANTPTAATSGSGGGIAGIGGSMSFLRDFSVPDLLAISNDFGKDVKDEKPMALSNVPSVTTMDNLDKQRGESEMNGLAGSYTDVSALGGGTSQPLLSAGPPSQELFSAANSNCGGFNGGAAASTGGAIGSASDGVANGATNGVINGMESVGALEDKLASEIQWKQQQQQPQQPQSEVKMLPAEMMGMRMTLQYPQPFQLWQVCALADWEETRRSSAPRDSQNSVCVCMCVSCSGRDVAQNLQATPVGIDSAFVNSTIPSVPQNNFQGMAVSSPDDHRNASGKCQPVPLTTRV